ncbi:hypothetical protein LTS15_007205 [Exophiala xenobiotica]|nr:hypothetical protein LTS15_007205 [Exophiala xenobiotica]
MRGHLHILGDKSAVHTLVATIGRYQTSLHDEVWIFESRWMKDSHLYQNVMKSRWEDVILDKDMKDDLIELVERFYCSRERYHRVRVPLKRGVIFYGPPGNGKTLSIKATMQTLYKRNPPFPTLHQAPRSTFATQGPHAGSYKFSLLLNCTLEGIHHHYLRAFQHLLSVSSNTLFVASITRSRRTLNETEDSVVSVTESLRSLMASSLRAASELTGLSVLDDNFFRSSRPDVILGRMLSTRSYISTTSSAADRNQAAHENKELRVCKQVGKGQCGTVYALIRTTEVFKVPNPGKADQLYNDCLMHKAAEEAFLSCFFELRRDLNIPHCVRWVLPSDTLFWNEYSHHFPQPTFGFMSSRILPLPLPVREALFETFAPKSILARKEEFLTREENKDCLVRLYLGRRDENRRSDAFRLRNFDLKVNEMELLKLDTTMFARTMSQALAVLHWKAGIDANDVEWVLGSAPKYKEMASSAQLRTVDKEGAKLFSQDLDFHQRSIGVWLIDFDQCKTFSHDKDGVKQLERGFFFNDPYYPRPHSKHEMDVALWATFRDQYLATSAGLTESEMPKLFIEAIILFPNPSIDERVQYCHYWQQKLRDNKEIDFPDEICQAAAKITEGFSFAYIQEAFVTALLSIAREKQGAAETEEGDDMDELQGAWDLIEVANTDNEKDLDDYILWRKLKYQIELLRKELGNKEGD